MNPLPENQLHRISIVIPIYRGEKTLPLVIDEIAALATARKSPAGHEFQIAEVILVHDGAVDSSDRVMEELREKYLFVHLVWLSRNYGQHPATLAGMASTTCPWVVTMDEDGQQNPADIGTLLDTALEQNTQLVYAKPLNPPPHGFLRNALSASAKWLFIHVLGNKTFGSFNSFRLIDGEIARTLAAYAGSNVFLDVALSWVIGRVAHAPVELRGEHGHRSGYTLRSLLGHFWRLLLTSGTRPLRFIMLIGVFSIIIAFLLSFYALWVKFYLQYQVQGWTSLVIVTSFFSGGILLSLGIIAEYLAVALGIVMGKPLYVVTSKPMRRP